MSTIRSADRTTRGAVRHRVDGSHLAAASQLATEQAAPVDPRLVEQTKQQVETLAAEIAELAQADGSLEEFARGFLARLIEALAAVGGALWLVDRDGAIRKQFQINHFSGTSGDDEAIVLRHQALLKQALQERQPLAIPPRSGVSPESEAGNPTEHLLLLGQVVVGRQVEAIVEIVQRPGRGPATQRGYQRFLAQMCELAADFLQRRHLRHLSRRDSQWRQLEQFLTELHAGLDLRQTLYTIANEGRRLLDCDRVSVVLCQGRRCRVEVVSGLDSIDRRAQQVKRLGLLSRAVIKAGEPLWYRGQAENLPPQIDASLHSYLDKSHARALAVLPLQRGLPSDNDQQHRSRARETLGALIIEQIEDAGDTAKLQERGELLARHSALALTNVVDHNRLFLLPLWRALGKSRWVVELRNLPKVLIVVCLLALGAAALCLAPQDFDLAADGKLRPERRSDVFAGINGMLVEIAVEHAQQVTAGQVVARLRNTDLEVELTTLLSQRSSTRQRIVAAQRSLLDGPRLTPQQQNQLHGELAQLSETAESLERQLALYREKEKLLDVTSPADGQIVTWQVRDKLLRRPVQQGQRLLTVVDPNGDWQLEVEVPERRMGHIATAARSSGEPLEVTFVPATHPHLQLTGRVVKIDRTADVRGEAGNSVLVRVAIDKSQLPDLRDGAKVTARIHCGSRPLGYVLFHDLIETVQQKILFWF